MHFLKLIDWQNLTHLLCICEQNCFYDIYGVGHVNSENKSQANSVCTMRYDWFAVCLINIKIIIFEGLNMVIKQIIIFEASDIVTESKYSNFYQASSLLLRFKNVINLYVIFKALNDIGEISSIFL